MNKGVFNEEASPPLTLPLPVQLFHYSEWEVRAAGPPSWVYWRRRLTGSKHNQIMCSKGHFYSLHRVMVILHCTPLAVATIYHISLCMHFTSDRKICSIFPGDALNLLILKWSKKLFTHQSTLESIISFQEEFELGGLETLCHFSCMDCIH